MKVKFTIDGEAKGKERPKFSRKTGKPYTPEQTVLYENWIKLLYGTKVRHYFESDVRMSVTCYYGITKTDKDALEKGKINTKKYQEAKSKIDGSIRPHKKPDLDNVIKAIADALNQVAYKDDAQVVEVVASKYYSDNPRVEVTIEDI